MNGGWVSGEQCSNIVCPSEFPLAPIPGKRVRRTDENKWRTDELENKWEPVGIIYVSVGTMGVRRVRRVLRWVVWGTGYSGIKLCWVWWVRWVRWVRRVPAGAAGTVGTVDENGSEPRKTYFHCNRHLSTCTRSPELSIGPKCSTHRGGVFRINPVG